MLQRAKFAEKRLGDVFVVAIIIVHLFSSCPTRGILPPANELAAQALASEQPAEREEIFQLYSTLDQIGRDR